ncbi:MULTISPECIES: sulfite reductase subunit A [Caldilinea]|jgi:ferredoxin|uniref:Putative NiFe hydrogenase beta subunit n=1 Tax=Caldilinea aerophila (strain DSM 14535 / JCM 11387 / NBRC 104270 / STL-6-O1) TaxID=926550 RepID=I0I3X5_CALAS|nr:MULTISPECIES: sulfite reductase subunit A [Caldilinea]MBO9393575.1 sulfite reductase subunit A [Caldilinea sp.]BAL99962.1 putative NiFe hydrogenase beta subunit [Caldilinea aerophila DSM 14535 = NBRC 104270]GIV73369.1 MAG: 4Fe-4S ferredoxin [Caldilinea sp.]
MGAYEFDDRACLLERSALQKLLDVLRSRGYTTVGPQIEHGVIVYDELHRIEELPIGWTDVQEGGSYRLERRNDDALFGYNVGPHSWKRFLSPPLRLLWRARKTEDGFEFVVDEEPPPRYALIGVRACELHAIQQLDAIYMGGPVADGDYQRRREALFIVAVNCGKAGNTCFCASLGTGPGVGSGYDIALTELLDGEQRFVAVAGSVRGAEALAEIPHRPATDADMARAEEIVAETARHMGRHMETAGLKELLYRNLDHPHWDVVAQRCLTCGACTMVCPTCFCFTVEDATDLSGQVAERWRRFDSCFTLAFSFISSGSVRTSAKARYRQWLTHKLASWQDQFGAIGCVGCGRCITWCPVGIDITAEVAALRTEESGQLRPEPVAA